MGTSGVSTGQFEFDLFDENGVYSNMILKDCPVILYCTELYFTSRKYFISSRSVSKKVCHFTCYDRMCMTDKLLDISDIIFDKDNSITADGVISAVAHQCGFAEGYGASANGIEHIKFKKSDIDNITCRRALELISEAMCGVWSCDENNKLYLACLGSAAYGDYAYSDNYSEIDFTGKNIITALTMINSSDGAEFLFDNGQAGTVIEIESPVITENLAEAVWERLNGYVYTSWNCDNADVTGGNLKCMTGLSFAPAGGDTLFASNTLFTVNNSGIIFSGGSPAHNEWNYKNYLERRKLSIGKPVGNLLITENGAIKFYKNLNNGGGIEDGESGIYAYSDNNK